MSRVYSKLLVFIPSIEQMMTFVVYLIQLIQSSNSMTASSTLFKRHSIEEFHTMLKFTLRRMKSHPHVRLDYKENFLDYFLILSF